MQLREASPIYGHGPITPTAHMCMVIFIDERHTGWSAENTPKHWQPLHILLHRVGVLLEPIMNLIPNKGLQCSTIVVLGGVRVQSLPDLGLHTAKDVLDGAVQIRAVRGQLQLLGININADGSLLEVWVMQGADLCTGLDLVIIVAENDRVLCFPIPRFADVVEVVLELLFSC